MEGEKWAKHEEGQSAYRAALENREQKKKKKKKVHFGYVLTAGRNRFRQENIYGDREETFFKEKLVHKICSYI